MSGVSVAKKNGGQSSAIFANDTRWRPNSQILHRRDRSNSRVTETARPSGVLLSIEFDIAELKYREIFYTRDLWKLAGSCKQLRLLCLPDPWNLSGTALLSGIESS